MQRNLKTRAAQLAARRHLLGTAGSKHTTERTASSARPLPRRAPHPARLPERQRAASRQQLQVEISRKLLAVLANERQENGPFSEEYKASAQQLLGKLFHTMGQLDAEWQARVDAVLNGDKEGTC